MHVTLHPSVLFYHSAHKLTVCARQRPKASCLPGWLSNRRSDNDEESDYYAHNASIPITER